METRPASVFQLQVRGQVLFGSRSAVYTYVFSHSGPIQAGAEKLGICGSVRGRPGTLGRGTLARLLVNDLPVSAGGEVRSMVEKERNVKRNKRQRRNGDINNRATQTTVGGDGGGSREKETNATEKSQILLFTPPLAFTFWRFFVEECSAANIVPERSVSLSLPFVPRRRPARHLLPHFHCFCFIHTSTSIRRRRTRRRRS